MKIFKYIDLTIEYIKRNFAGHMEYRINFVMEIVCMTIQNGGFAAIWVIFFSKFNIVNDWTINDILLLHAIAGIYYAIGATVAGGMIRIGDKIAKGEIDFFLTLPKDVLWHILVSHMKPSVLGEYIFGILMFILSGYFSITNTLLLISTGILAAAIFVSSGIIYHSLSFFFGKTHELAERMIWSILGFTLYPQSIFQGNIRILLYTLMPAGFIAGIPVELIKEFDINKLAILFVATLIFMTIARIIFYKGLKKYESGNLINVQL